MNAHPPRLSATLDLGALRETFERFGRLHVPDIFMPDDAQLISQAMSRVSWVRSTIVNGKPYDLGPQALEVMPDDRRRQLDEAVAAGARTGFQYRFDAWRLSDLVDSGAEIAAELAPLKALYRMTNSAAFLDFLKAITGEDRIAFCDAQATRYRAGDFLTVHDDGVEGKNRLFAFVLSFTPAWRADWGGLLVFHDRDGHVAEGYTPVFNSLNIFRVPQPHAVTQVASFVTAERLSVTGWVRHR